MPIHWPTLKVLASTGDDEEVTFSCFASDFSPKDHEIKWLRNGVEITNKTNKIESLEGKTNENGTVLYSTASFLVMQQRDLDPNTEFTCKFEMPLKKGAESKNSSLTYQPQHQCCE